MIIRWIIVFIVFALLLWSSAAKDSQLTFYQPVWHESVILNNHGGILTLAHSDDAHDPTYAEAINVTLLDRTDKHPFEYGKYDCSDFAQDFQHNVTGKYNIKCYVCVMRFKRNVDGSWQAHYVNVFNTTDKGLLFIDCSSGDCIGHVEEGILYTAEPIIDPSGEISYCQYVVQEYIIV